MLPKIPSLYIASMTSFSGKTAVCLGLAQTFKDQGYKVGYFKPLGWEMSRTPEGKPIDEDTLLMKEILDLDIPLETLSPIVFHNMFLEESCKMGPDFYEKRVFKSYEEASKGMDIMVVEGPCILGLGASMGIDPGSLAKKLGAYFLLVSKADGDADIDQIINEKKCLEAINVNFVGTVLNYVPKLVIERIKGFAVPALERHGIKILGVIPENIFLRAPSVREIYEVLGGTILTRENKMDILVEDFLVGAMTPESALRYFRRSINKAVITGGDRADIQHAALQTSTSVLILTGNLYPDVRVLARAEELGIPVLLVPYDTYTTVMKISAVAGRIKPKDMKKIELAKELVEEHVEWKWILKILIQK